MPYRVTWDAVYEYTPRSVHFTYAKINLDDLHTFQAAVHFPESAVTRYPEIAWFIIWVVMALVVLCGI